jgi:hypothetical protein
MKAQLTRELIEKYPTLFDRNPKTCVTLFGFECGDGWYNLLDSLFFFLEYENKNGSEDNPITLTQVKEKFGTLRVYYIGGRLESSAVDSMINLAERLSGVTCEECGAPGEIDHKAGWLRCRCKAHTKED